MNLNSAFFHISVKSRDLYISEICRQTFFILSEFVFCMEKSTTLRVLSCVIELCKIALTFPWKCFPSKLQRKVKEFFAMTFEGKTLLVWTSLDNKQTKIGVFLLNQCWWWLWWSKALNERQVEMEKKILLSIKSILISPQ